MDYLFYAIGVAALWFISIRLRSVLARQWLYLIASWVFYFTWGSWLIAILIASSLMNYGLGEWLKKRTTSLRLWTGILLNLALLSFFKYLPLLGGIVPDHSPLASLKRILFPLGISFWTFQALSYLFELYREEDLDPTLLEFCLYMSFWPTVLQGPICRMSAMLPQFRQPWSVTDDDIKIGVRRISIGVLMSLLGNVMGGGLYAGTGVDAGFSRSSYHLGGLDVWILIIGYAFQLYFSFCGYSHVVIGAARLFGIQLHENFDRPYFSTTPSNFWTRWHMSLSFWIRDFLFLPLATIRREVWWRNLSLVIAMFVFGLWHKGSVLLMMWGVYHGVLLVLHRQWQELRKRLDFEWTGTAATLISWFLTFSAVCVGYIFFRAETVPQASAMLKAILSPASYRIRALNPSFYVMVLTAALGYFLVIGAGEVLDRLAVLATPSVPGRAAGLRALLGMFAAERWVWVTPLVLVLVLYLSVIFQPGQSETGPIMYALF